MLYELKTNLGSMHLELFADKAPNTVKNFIAYADSGYYNGLIFHRVIPNFMIQGGGFEPGMSQKETNAQIANEANNGVKNDFGTIAMARTGDPHSATSQFFINVKNNDFLNFRAQNRDGWGYCAFGKIVKGDEVLNLIAQVKTGSAAGHSDVPVQDVIIEFIKPVIDDPAALK